MILRTLSILGACALTACAGLPPGGDEMARLPVVRFGDSAPTGQSFILLYPAGAPLPVETRIHGSLLQEEARGVLTVRTKQDVYTYKQWASLDGKTWKPGNQVVGGQFSIAVPGEKDGHNPGSMRAEFNLK
ncbi:MAG TPA: hypothetical protein PKL46_22510 [Aquabacterium sp.]|nr:hypothetical protein [Aquabacterium sp.]